MKSIRDRTRRGFLGTTVTLAMAPAANFAKEAESFSFVLLGDLHYDKLEHHDMAWLEKNKGGDLNQIRNYSRITEELMPSLFASVKETVAASGAAFVVQVGDLVQGLCGTAELAGRQNREVLDFVDRAELGVPFLFTKGNHDITGDGAKEAFAEVFHPFLSQESALFAGGGSVSSANYAIEHGDAMFCFFDAYDKASLDWFEATVAKRTARHCFVIVHPPVVPYGARATWHLFANANDGETRAQFLNLLGRHEAVVLGGHLHKFSNLVRETSAGGRFTQFALSSVIGTADPEVKSLLEGVNHYNSDQVKLEPSHSPETELERRAIYEVERELVKDFDYADLPGHAVVTVKGNDIMAELFAGTGRRLWRTLSLSNVKA